jgi:hypothetical protein
VLVADRLVRVLHHDSRHRLIRLPSLPDSCLLSTWAMGRVWEFSMS